MHQAEVRIGGRKMRPAKPGGPAEGRHQIAQMPPSVWPKRASECAPLRRPGTAEGGRVGSRAMEDLNLAILGQVVLYCIFCLGPLLILASWIRGLVRRSDDDRRRRAP